MKMLICHPPMMELKGRPAQPRKLGVPNALRARSGRLNSRFPKSA